jgi:hypothetical protein
MGNVENERSAEFVGHCVELGIVLQVAKQSCGDVPRVAEICKQILFSALGQLGLSERVRLKRNRLRSVVRAPCRLAQRLALRPKPGTTSAFLL